MGIYSALFFGLLVAIAVGEELPEENSQDSLVPVTIFITTEQYRSCKEDGHCTFTPRSVSFNDGEEIPETFEGKSYFQLCQKIHRKMEKLEAEHPELKSLKLKLIKMFDSFAAEFESESEKGELIAVKLLDLIKGLIEKLKAELKDKPGKEIPEPPTIETTITEEEVTAEPEPGHPAFYGSIRGIPGIHFPNYTEIPITSFSCSDKTHIPGFYADLETGCQVFHLCYEHRRESFLCPIGTIFNQALLVCDYWYSANCSQAPIYYDDTNIPDVTDVVEEKIGGKIVKVPKETVGPKFPMKDILKFLPVKAKVTDIPKFEKSMKTPNLKDTVAFQDAEIIADKIFDGILSLGSRVIAKTSDLLQKMPVPQEEIQIVSKPKPIPVNKLAFKAFPTVPFIKAKKVASAAKFGAAAKVASAAGLAAGKAKMASFAAVPIMKAKVASAAAVPIMKAKVASAAAVPIMKAKVASAAAVPIMKAKVASAAAVPIMKAKVASAAAVPIMKAKVASAAIPLAKFKAASVKMPIVKGALFTLPLAKAKLRAAAIPAFKAKKAAKAVPYLKMAALKPKLAMAPLKVKAAIALPVMKAKLAKAAVSPLTKKALALGYLKLLKAKKLALMG